MFQDGGGAILGHRGASVLAAMKNAFSQGLAARLPSVWEARLEAAVARMFPAYGAVRLYSSRQRALEAAGSALGMRLDPSEVFDPALAPFAAAPSAAATAAALWRPFLPPGKGAGGRADRPAAVLLPVLPFSVCQAPSPACFLEELPEGAPGSDLVPGFLLAGALRALASLEHGTKRRDFAGLPLDGNRGWERVGPYVRPVFDRAEYPRVFAEFLRAGVLLSPEYPGPSILPGECSPGEEKLLAGLFARVPGG